MISVPGYRIQHLLSWGAQGDVFLALDGDGQEVALKVVSAQRSSGDRVAVDRLRREARLLRSIESPHVVAVRALVETAELSCLVLEYLRGQRLDQVIRARAIGADAASPAAVAETVVVDRASLGATGPATAPQSVADTELEPEPELAPRPAATPAALCTPAHVAFAVQVVAQLARGLHELHAINLVHRDIKPENAMLVDGRVVLIDFGLARAFGVTTLTRSGAVVGSLAYMSPEQLHGFAATARSDVYCLGATLHYCLVGSPPHAGGSASLAQRASSQRAATVRRANACVSRDLDAVLRRALEPDPRDRYADAAAMLDDLQRCERGEAVVVPFSPARTWRHHRRSLRIVLLAAALLLVSWMLWPDASLTGRVAEVLAQVRARSSQAVEVWQQLPDASRQAALHELNRRVGGDVELAHATARSLRLGLLRLAPRAGHLVALRSKPTDHAPPMPAMAEFFPLEQPRCLLAEPGQVVLMVMSANRQAWWGPSDPRCLQLLQELAVPTQLVAERSVQILPTEARTLRCDWHAVAAGVFELVGSGSKPIALAISQPYMVDRLEVSNAGARQHTVWVRGLQAPREELDSWIRHPAEPVSAADEFWAQWGTDKSASDEHPDLPALMTFWTAHRLAALCGARLPSYAEWIVAGRSGVTFNFQTQHLADTELVAVDSTPPWDQSSSGVKFANSNAREWLANHRAGGEASCAAVPALLLIPDRPQMFSFIILPRLPYNSAPYEKHGLRLYRSVVPL